MKRIFPKSEFSRNVLILMSGTTIAQAIPIAISPILTRIFTPEEFGLFALYIAITSIVAVIATGRYELAIILPKKQDDAFQITLLASLITLVVSMVFLVVVMLFNNQIALLLQNPEIAPWLYLIPLSVLISGLYQVLSYWHVRNKRYSNIATNRVIQSAGTATSQLCLGVSLQSTGLIVGQLIGQALSLAYLLKTYFKKDHQQQKLNGLKLKALAKRYSQFPKIDVPTALINISANQAPNILLAILFSVSSAGLYYLTQRVLQAPVTLISGSVLDVFKQRASEDYKKYGHCREIFKKTFWILFFMALPPSLFLYFWIEELFAFVFGEPWREAGMYAQLLIPALFLRFVVNPLSFIIYIAEKQLWNLTGMALLIIFIVTSLFISKSPESAIFLISCSYVLIYLLYFFISARLARVI